MYKLPVPFKEKGVTKTVDIQQGYAVDCDCVPVPVRIDGGNIVLSGVTIDTSAIEAQLNTLITSNNTQSTLLQDILDENIAANADLTQTMITGTTVGSIPAGVQSYTIINLGLDPTDPSTAVDPMIINGIPITSRFVSFSNTTGSVKSIDNAITYDPNGNTLLIVYLS